MAHKRIYCAKEWMEMMLFNILFHHIWKFRHLKCYSSNIEIQGSAVWIIWGIAGKMNSVSIFWKPLNSHIRIRLTRRQESGTLKTLSLRFPRGTMFMCYCNTGKSDAPVRFRYEWLAGGHAGVEDGRQAWEWSPFPSVLIPLYLSGRGKSLWTVLPANLRAAKSQRSSHGSCKTHGAHEERSERHSQIYWLQSGVDVAIIHTNLSDIRSRWMWLTGKTCWCLWVICVIVK